MCRNTERALARKERGFGRVLEGAQAEPTADGAGKKEALGPAAELGVKGQEAPVEKAAVTKGKASRKSKVNLKGGLPAEPAFLRIVRHDLKSSGAPYIGTTPRRWTDGA